MGAAGALFYTIEMNGVRQVRKMIQLDGDRVADSETS